MGQTKVAGLPNLQGFRCTRYSRRIPESRVPWEGVLQGKVEKMSIVVLDVCWIKLWYDGGVERQLWDLFKHLPLANNASFSRFHCQWQSTEGLISCHQCTQTSAGLATQLGSEE